LYPNTRSDHPQDWTHTYTPLLQASSQSLVWASVQVSLFGACISISASSMHHFSVRVSHISITHTHHTPFMVATSMHQSHATSPPTTHHTHLAAACPSHFIVHSTSAFCQASPGALGHLAQTPSHTQTLSLVHQSGISTHHHFGTPLGSIAQHSLGFLSPPHVLVFSFSSHLHLGPFLHPTLPPQFTTTQARGAFGPLGSQFFFHRTGPIGHFHFLGAQFHRQWVSPVPMIPACSVPLAPHGIWHSHFGMCPCSHVCFHTMVGRPHWPGQGHNHKSIFSTHNEGPRVQPHFGPIFPPGDPNTTTTFHNLVHWACHSTNSTFFLPPEIMRRCSPIPGGQAIGPQSWAVARLLATRTSSPPPISGGPIFHQQRPLLLPEVHKGPICLIQGTHPQGHVKSVLSSQIPGNCTHSKPQTQGKGHIWGHNFGAVFPHSGLGPKGQDSQCQDCE